MKREERRRQIVAALGLSETAARSEVEHAFRAVLDVVFDDGGDPRAELASLAERIAADRGIALGEALDRARAQNPRLAEAVGAFYASR